jgi:hypothetical protein
MLRPEVAKVKTHDYGRLGVDCVAILHVIRHTKPWRCMDDHTTFLKAQRRK